MGVKQWKQIVAAAVACTVLGGPVAAGQQDWRRGARTQDRDWRGGPDRAGYERGYREGLRQGEQDARANRAFDYQRDRAYRDADRGYNRNVGSRDVYRTEFRQGFASGYRTGYERIRRIGTRPLEQRGDRRIRGGYQEPAFARGFADGYAKGLDDGRDRDRYDPVRHGDYREADQGYYRQYGSKDAYRNNYRAGFRQGYEDGYRDGTRRR